MKKIIAAFLVIILPALSLGDTGPGCGLGANLLEGKSGLLMHLFAGTSNATGSQTIGMTSATWGCDTSKPISVASFFIDQNKEKVALDFARGEGESLEALGQILQVEEKDQFNQFVQDNFASIYSTSATGGDIVASLVELMKQDSTLAKYAS